MAVAGGGERERVRPHISWKLVSAGEEDLPPPPPPPLSLAAENNPYNLSPSFSFCVSLSSSSSSFSRSFLSAEKKGKVEEEANKASLSHSPSLPASHLPSFFFLK